MIRTSIYLLVLCVGQFLFLPAVADDDNSECSSLAKNIRTMYQECTAPVLTRGPIMDFKYGIFSNFQVGMKNAFAEYCTHTIDINTCVTNRLMSQTCGRNISDLYILMAAKSNSFCGGSSSMSKELADLFQMSSPTDLEMIDRCKPSKFDFTLCRRLADSARTSQLSDVAGESDNQETEYLLELSLCVYSSVFVGCPKDTVILTLFYELDEWLPPRLAANTTEVIAILKNWRNTFY